MWNERRLWIQWRGNVLHLELIWGTPINYAFLRWHQCSSRLVTVFLGAAGGFRPPAFSAGAKTLYLLVSCHLLAQPPGSRCLRPPRTSRCLPCGESRVGSGLQRARKICQEETFHLWTEMAGNLTSEGSLRTGWGKKACHHWAGFGWEGSNRELTAQIQSALRKRDFHLIGYPVSFHVRRRLKRLIFFLFFF